MPEDTNVASTTPSELASTEPASPREVMVHVRFSPAGGVSEISFPPTGATPQAWFDTLSRKYPASFRALSGGRGLFVLPAATLEKVRSSIAAA